MCVGILRVLHGHEDTVSFCPHPPAARRVFLYFGYFYGELNFLGRAVLQYSTICLRTVNGERTLLRRTKAIWEPESHVFSFYEFRT